jgi:hypothetical protein
MASIVPTWTPRTIAELCCFEVIVAVGAQKGEGAEARQDRLLVPRAEEPLKELLVDEAGGRDQLAFRERSLESGDLGHVGRPVATQRQRPDARVDEEAQPRERSRLQS